MLEYPGIIAAAADAIRRNWPGQMPRAGIILGTGLSNFSGHLKVEAAIDYDQIPHFPQATALGHRGQLVCGALAGVPVIAMAGRFHAYEGYSLATTTLPVRVMKHLGVELLIVSNASGGLNPRFASGDIVVIIDHINLMFDNPLIGDNDERMGPRFPDMSRPYDPALADQALSVARHENIAAHRGVYVAVQGPNLETRAEYRMLRMIGGDIVGMSTVPEVIVARHAGLRVLALSTVTNVCRPDALARVSGHQIVELAAAAEPKVRTIVTAIIADFGAPARQ
jgi:purine-nucleoside phosphorylase